VLFTTRAQSANRCRTDRRCRVRDRSGPAGPQQFRRRRRHWINIIYYTNLLKTTVAISIILYTHWDATANEHPIYIYISMNVCIWVWVHIYNIIMYTIVVGCFTVPPRGDEKIYIETYAVRFLMVFIFSALASHLVHIIYYLPGARIC